MQSSRLSVVCWLTAPTSLRSNSGLRPLRAGSFPPQVLLSQIIYYGTVVEGRPLLAVLTADFAGDKPGKK